MIYQDFGQTGVKISRLGFGTMRLPVSKESNHDELERAAALVRHGISLGINYIDSAFMYGGGSSELAVGLALKGEWRRRALLATKLPLWEVNSPDDFFRILEKQLTKLQTDTIDFYHFHSVNQDLWKNRVMKHRLLDMAAKALDQKMIQRLSFSYHDTADFMREVIDTQAFCSLLCQYNLLDRSLESGIAYAREKGLGVVAMGPVGGGRLAFNEGIFEKAAGDLTTPELALRFVLANPNITCALSGMSTEAMLADNVRIASDASPLSDEEKAAVARLLEKLQELKKMYCTGCGYCQPCPAEVRIPDALQALIYRHVYRFEQASRNAYKLIGDAFHPGKPASACTQCGLCEKKCPQKLPIRQLLKEAAAAFEATRS